MHGANRTFLELLQKVDFDAETALVYLDIMLNCQRSGDALPAEVAKVQVTDSIYPKQW